MSDLSFQERIRLEKLLEMGSGYVLSFSNREFLEFVADSTGHDIYAATYAANGDSKANRLRTFWTIEPNHVVGKLLHELIAFHRASKGSTEDAVLLEECERIARRLQQSLPVDALDAIAADGSEPDFDAVVKDVHAAIQHNRPEAGLDRLHTFVTKLIRTWLHKRGLSSDRDKPLHSIFGEYVKTLRNAGHIESEMTARILKSSISIMDSFNGVRNMKSLAHDNPVLSYDESILIFNHVCGMVRFLKALEAKAEDAAAAAQRSAPIEEDNPF